MSERLNGTSLGPSDLSGVVAEVPGCDCTFYLCQHDPAVYALAAERGDHLTTTPANPGDSR